jgi:gliding motility-associated-like protein
MKRTLILFFFLFLVLASHTQPPYQKLYDNGAEFAQALGVTPTPDGGNAFVGIVNIPGQPSQVNLTKLTCNGTVQWTRLLGVSSTVDNIFPEVKTDSLGRIWFTSNIGSWNNYDGLVGVFSPDGDLIKAVRIGLAGRNDQIYGLAIGADKSIYVAGTTNSYGSDKSGNTAYGDVFVARLDSNLNMIWSRTLGNKEAIDTGYDLVLDAGGNPLITGRYIVNGTFFAFLLKLDQQGNVSVFKGYGESGTPHRTYGYGIGVTTDGHILLTGSTTLNKVDHTSIPDVFLLKTDDKGMLVFDDIFIPTTGSDNSESGSSVIEMADGRYAIGVPTMSFTQYTQGFVPNKNAVFVTDPTGNLSEARIYNKGASHYTRLEERDISFVLSNFSNFYSQPNPGAGPFRPLMIVTDEFIESGCEEVDVTSSLGIVHETWEVADITYSLDTNYTMFTYDVSNLFSFMSIETLCETPDELSANFMVPESICVGQIVPLLPNTTGEVVALEWDMGNGFIINSLLDTSYAYAQPGTYLVQLVARSACNEVLVGQSIIVSEAPTRSEEVFLCLGDSIFLGGNWVTAGGQYIDFISGNGCDTLLQTTVLEMDYNLLERDTSICAGDSIFLKGAYQKLEGTYKDTISGPQCDTIIQTDLMLKPCDCGLEFPNVFTPNADQNNDDFGPYIACDLKVQQYSMLIYNRYGTLVYESDDLTKRWDGKYKGADQPADVYGWVVQATYLFEDKEVAIIRRGDITLVR